MGRKGWFEEFGIGEKDGIGNDGWRAAEGFVFEEKKTASPK